MHWTGSFGSCPLFANAARAEPGSCLVTLVLVAWRICRNRRQWIGRNRDRRTRLQLELADSHDTVTRLQSLEDLGASLDPVAGLHEGAHRRQAGLAVVFLLLGGGRIIINEK